MALTLGAIVGGSYLFLRFFSDNFYRDGVALSRLIRAKRSTDIYFPNMKYTASDHFALAVSKFPQKPFLIFITENNTIIKFTFKQVDEISNQLANALSSSIKKGDKVALMMDNRPEFVITVLAIAKLGGTTALINTHLTASPLLHSFRTGGATKFIIGHEHVDVVKQARTLAADSTESKDATVKEGHFYSYGGSSVEGFTHLDPLIAKEPNKLSVPLPPTRSIEDHFVYIYTSGTTGLPKASVITSRRWISGGTGFPIVFGVKEDDVYYSALPLYHSSAFIIVLGTCITRGIPLVIRKKFSAKRFWQDCKETNATVVQYIGEICSYLLNCPPSPSDTDHNVRLAIGNGMRPNVWEEFRTRFNVNQIGEFYAATEGNATVWNMLNKTGAVGFVPNFLTPLYPLHIVKFDVETEQLIRDKNGLCIKCSPGETGQLVAQIIDGDPAREFKGYTSKEATSKKIIMDVFSKGDKYFSTGDLLYRDAQGFFYFADRVGDTFRWKGENVATGEVEAVLKSFPGIEDISVYGVPIPNTSGNAGMANIVISDKNIDYKKFWEFAKEKLPSYSRPIFLRVSQEIQMTGTFKHQKAALRKEGYNPNIVKDALYYSDPKKGSYMPLTQNVYNQVISGSWGAEL